MTRCVRDLQKYVNLKNVSVKCKLMMIIRWGAYSFCLYLVLINILLVNFGIMLKSASSLKIVLLWLVHEAVWQTVWQVITWRVQKHKTGCWEIRLWLTSSWVQCDVFNVLTAKKNKKHNEMKQTFKVEKLWSASVYFFYENRFSCL